MSDKPWTLIFPEFILFLSIPMMILSENIPFERIKRLTLYIPLTAILLAGAIGWLQFENPTSFIFTNALRIGPITQSFKALLLFCGAILLLLGWISKEIQERDRTEFSIIVIIGLIGTCILVSANQLIVLFLAQQLVWISSAILNGFNRKSRKSSEAALKTFHFSVFGSLFLAFGCVLYYGTFGSLSLTAFRDTAQAVNLQSAAFWLMWALFFVSVAVQLGIFPFHFITPDILEGAPTPAGGYSLVLNSVATLGIAIKFCFELFSKKEASLSQWTVAGEMNWTQIYAVIATATILIGNLMAFSQKKLKRRVGYLAIAQLGIIVLGFTVLEAAGISAMLFLMTSFALIFIGLLFVIQSVMNHTGGDHHDELEALDGLIWKSPLQGVSLCVFLAALIGLPPLIGFSSKLYMLRIMLSQHSYGLSAAFAVSIVLTLAAVLPMIFRTIKQTRVSQGAAPFISGRFETIVTRTALWILLFPTLALGIYCDPFLRYINRCIEKVIW